ncbi:F0F1 ATP synthase subunit epsilon [Oceaniovalibus sp. ACAM 378]|jgi:F-type H+-transporting ATPase subunit epsilon|uniref:F0F1 ATP synthase subunit epsilon n=1 Tax=Oceaniovalibus sp. ACAM 378 TaxID=2599923 RepID=UPI0011D8F1DC|nr:F0F1 ATP synthase subunit epsilon [Oceaniovalibus sp. ACAM 378]TYB90739.1 F0F1 ATP synthase subunit epsilon [Oceaniovalibus sp. ACAM 378]
MADTMHFSLVSPERSLASMQVTEVLIPGAEGDLTAMPQHSPTITTLRPGVLRATGPEGVVEYVVTGGFAEISTDGVTVLAERAMARNDVSQDDFDSMVQEAAEAHGKARETFQNQPGPVDDAAKLLADMVAMGTHIGMSTKQSSL